MLLHHEYLWLAAYIVIIVAAVVAAIASGFVWWIVLLIGILGTLFAFLGWTWQVGRFG